VLQPPLPVEEFLPQLEEILEKHHVRHSRFIQTFVDRGISESLLRIFLKEYYWGMAFDGFFAFAAVAANMPPRSHRADYFAIMRNLGSEAGVGHEGGRSHDEMQLLLPNHLGISTEEMLDHVATAPTHGYRNTVVASSFRSWETSVACIPFTVEGQGGEMHRLMWEGFQRHFDYPIEVMEYWQVHDELEGEHGDVGRALLAPACETSEQQWRVRDTVLATCLTYRAMWDQFDAMLD
jgi:pyrroloquinoline quinone (PQQ) biosynthesis protein C